MDAGERLFHQACDQFLVVGALDFHFEMVPAVEVFVPQGHERFVGQAALGPFQRDLEPAQHCAVAREIHAVALFEFAQSVFDEQLIEVVAAQMRVAVAGLDFHYPLLDDDHRHVESAAAEVIDKHGFVGGAARAVRERGGGWLVDDAHHFQSGQLAGDLRGLALALVEEGGNGDDRLADGLAELLFPLDLQFAQDEGGDFFGRKLFVAQRDACFLAHFSFDGEDGGVGSGDELIPGRLADNQSAGRVEADARGQGGLSVDVDDFDLAVEVDSEDGVGGAEVNADDEFVHSEIK